MSNSKKVSPITPYHNMRLSSIINYFVIFGIYSPYFFLYIEVFPPKTGIFHSIFCFLQVLYQPSHSFAILLFFIYHRTVARFVL